MKQKIFSAILLTGVLVACGNDDTSEQNRDSANMLQDTLPAGGFKEAIGVDSHPADATHVDSILTVPR